MCIYIYNVYIYIYVKREGEDTGISGTAHGLAGLDADARAAVVVLYEMDLYAFASLV